MGNNLEKGYGAARLDVEQRGHRWAAVTHSEMIVASIDAFSTGYGMYLEEFYATSEDN